MRISHSDDAYPHRIVRSSRHARDLGLLYLAILAAVMPVSFAGLRTFCANDAAGRQEAAARVEVFLAGSVHALDRCRARPWPFSLERRRARLAARHLPFHSRGRLCPGTMGYARKPVLLLSHSRYCVRVRPDRGENEFVLM